MYGLVGVKVGAATTGNFIRGKIHWNMIGFNCVYGQQPTHIFRMPSVNQVSNYFSIDSYFIVFWVSNLCVLVSASNLFLEHDRKQWIIIIIIIIIIENSVRRQKLKN